MVSQPFCRPPIDPPAGAIYDGDEHQKFMERLDSRIKSHDKDIERMCNYHYQGFIDSIRELLQVRSQAKSLNSEVVQLDEELQASAASVVVKGEELVQARRVESNIAAAIENLSLCLPVLTTYAKLQKQMKEKRYYPALKTLEQLEHLYLPRVANYRFSHQMKENIPKLRENIKEASMSDLKDFLENIRKFSPKIGEVAMRHTAEHLRSDLGVVGKKKRQAPAPPNPFTGEIDYEPPAESTYDAEEDLSAQDLIDFSPVYRCLHIYSVLGSRETFETYYRKQRKKQARLVLQPPTNMHETIAGYRAYIHGIVGFFVVEDHVLNTGNGLVNRTYLDEVWNMALSKIVNALRTHSVKAWKGKEGEGGNDRTNGTNVTAKNASSSTQKVPGPPSDGSDNSVWPRGSLVVSGRPRIESRADSWLKAPLSLLCQLEGRSQSSGFDVGVCVVADHESRCLVFQDRIKLYNPTLSPLCTAHLIVIEVQQILIPTCPYVSGLLYRCYSDAEDKKPHNAVQHNTQGNSYYNYGYSVNQLFDLLHEIREHYNEVLMQRWVQVFREILDEESYLPIQVSSQAEYDNVLETFPFHDQALEQLSFPKRFPFSPLVPKIYQQVKEFIYACLKFSEDLNLSQGEVDDMIRKSTNLLLSRSFSGCLSYLFRKPSLALLQVIQIIIDTGYLEEATVYLEEFVSNITGAPKEGHMSGRSQGQSCMFRVARDDAERQICDKLKRKLDEFLELENYDWLLVEPRGHASSFITDLIAFLQSIFLSFTNLPPEVAQEACKSACEHIAKSVLNFMLSDDVKQISMGALQQINLDTIQCEQFAASEPVPGLQEGVLLQYFADLRQLLDLFMTWDWPTYFHDYGQDNSKYQQVYPNTAIILLEKLREADKKTVFSVLKKSERDKKKLLETVLKQLRQLAQTAQQ
uniref:Exocyst complex component n=2 Tax=Timema TaxID=61471 RepID=A0A7R9HKV2_9NEOP|nr:unnamed protein product [Timema monikensis]